MFVRGKMSNIYRLYNYYRYKTIIQFLGHHSQICYNGAVWIHDETVE